MELDKKQIDDILTELQPSIINTLKSEITKRVEWQVLDAVSTEISKFTKEWVAENVIPELKKSLIENKKSLVSIGISLSESITTTLAEELTKELSENLSSSYKRTAILKALFNS